LYKTSAVEEALAAGRGLEAGIPSYVLKFIS
jgi:hypothetical protein